MPEELRYTINHSLAGHLGDLWLKTTKATGTAGQELWAGQGKGNGSFLGFGSRSDFATRYDPKQGMAQAWSLHRDTGKAIIVDEAEQVQPGIVATHRQRSDKPEEWATLNSGAPTFDPFSFLMALRTRGDRKFSAPVLEGRALWQVTAEPVQGETIVWDHRSVQTIRYRLQAQPLDWERQPSKTRQTRTFAIWLSATPDRTPLALTTSAPLGEIRIELQPAVRVAQH